MIEAIGSFFSSVFGDNIVLATILIAMVPVIELRGAIPFATNSVFWGELAISNWQSYLWGFIGSSLIVPVLALLFIPFMNWLKKTRVFKKMASAIENRIQKKASAIENSNKEKRNKYLKYMVAIFVFVAIPLPLTGAWTGTCVAIFLGLDFFSTCLSVIAGNAAAGLIVCLILEFFPWLNDWLFLILVGIILLIGLISLIRNLINKHKNLN